MKVIPLFVAFLCAISSVNAWASPASNGQFLYSQDLNDELVGVDTFLRLSNMRCEHCTLIVRDLIETGAVGNTVGAIKNTMSGDSNYAFRLDLLTACNHCYRAAHFWEMNILNRTAKNDEIDRWLESEESKVLVDYFQNVALSTR